MNPETYQPILDWISAHPHWSGFIVFLISLSESLAIIGLVVPGVVLMTAIGGMMGSGILPFWLTLMWAILGAIAGDGISYWLGYHYHQHLRDFWPFKQFPGLLARGELFFKKHGGTSIIFGRFVGPVRPMIPVIAGMMDMKPKRFLLFNILSAIVWAPLYSLPGILIGASLGSLSSKAANRVGVLVILLLLLLWLMYILARTVGRFLIKIIEASMHHIWKIAHHSTYFSWLMNLLKVKQGTEHGQLGLLLLSITSLTIFIVIVFNLSDHAVIQLNDTVYQILRALYSTRCINACTLLTGLGEPYVILPATGIIGLLLFISKRYVAAFCWTLTICFGFLLGDIIKHWLDIPRPDGLLHTYTGLSFPSGHALIAVLFYGLCAFLIQDSLKPKFRWLIWGITIILITLISLSRLYLGIHWFIDIVGSLSLGLSLISFGYACYRHLAAKSISSKILLIPVFLTISLGMFLYSTFWYPQIRGNFTREWTTHTLSEQDWWMGQGNVLSLFSRTGAIKRMATIFDLQWLGTLTDIEATLEKLEFKKLPQLTWNSGLVALEDNPSPLLFPVAPKFHRDRLPALVVSKPLNERERLVLQLWQSDFYTQQNIPLWVGTLRKETLEHPVPLIAIYREEIALTKTLSLFQEELKKSPQFISEMAKLIDSKTDHQYSILLIKPQH